MTLRDYKRAVRAEAISDLEQIADRLDRIWHRAHPIPPKPGAPVIGEDIPAPTPEEVHRQLMAMHVDERDLLLASSGLHEIIDDLRLILPSKGGAS